MLRLWGHWDSPKPRARAATLESFIFLHSSTRTCRIPAYLRETGCTSACGCSQAVIPNASLQEGPKAQEEERATALRGQERRRPACQVRGARRPRWARPHSQNFFTRQVSGEKANESLRSWRWSGEPGSQRRDGAFPTGLQGAGTLHKCRDIRTTRTSGFHGPVRNCASTKLF